MKTKMCIIGIFLLASIYALAQKEYNNEINKFNDKGQKEGFWTEEQGSDSIELYYRNGVRSGVFKSFSNTGKLRDIGEFLNGNYAGTWYSFEDDGHLLSIQKDFSINTDTVLRFGTEKYVYPYKCYHTSYYPNGQIQDEGTLLWNEDPMMDTSREYGEWKYYDKSGRLIKTKVFGRELSY